MAASVSLRTLARASKGKRTTIAEHMPAAHRAHMDTPGRLLSRGASVGPGAGLSCGIC